MEKHLKRLPAEVFVLIQCASETAAHRGEKAYLVGGFVRDLVLGVPNSDLDICVEGDGIAYAQDYARRSGARVTVHARFGTATVFLPSHHKVDVASTRQEVYAAPGALPLVSRSGLKEDLARRDFTINTLALNLGKGSFGELVDLFGARNDIRAGAVRILHDASFLDDPTRIIRAIRFEQRYGFHIEPHTLRCLKQAVDLHMFKAVGPQRLRDEIILLLTEKHPLRQISRFSSLAGLDIIHPDLRLNVRTKDLLESVQRQVAWFERKCTSHRRLDSWLVYMMALLDGHSPEVVRQVCDQFVLRASERTRILSYARGRDALIAALRPANVRPSRIYQLLEGLSFETIIMLKAKARQARADAHITMYLEELHNVRISLTGHHLKDLGIAPGPLYQQLLQAVLCARLDGTVKTKDDELMCARQWLKAHH